MLDAFKCYFHCENWASNLVLHEYLRLVTLMMMNTPRPGPCDDSVGSLREAHVTLFKVMTRQPSGVYQVNHTAYNTHVDSMIFVCHISTWQVHISFMTVGDRGDISSAFAQPVLFTGTQWLYQTLTQCKMIHMSTNAVFRERRKWYVIWVIT